MTGSGPTVRGELRDQIPPANIFVLDANGGIESRFRVIEENRPIDHQRSAPQLSEILGLTAFVPNNHRVPRIDYRYVERAVVFTLEQKLRLIL